MPVRGAPRVATGLAGVVLASVVLSGCATTGVRSELATDPGGSPTPSPSETIPAPEPSPREEALRSLVAWSPDVLPARTARVLERMDDVHDATTAEAGLQWLQMSRRPDGSVDRPPTGYSFPFELAYIHPRGFAKFAPVRYRPAIRAIGRDEIVIPETEARLRGSGRGTRLRISGRSVRVSAVVSDRAAQGYEGILRGPRPSSWSAPDRFVLIHLEPDGKKSAVRRKIESISEPGLRLQLRSNGVKPFLRYADAVQPQLVYKKALGEFAARPIGGGALEITPRWMDAHISYASVPLLGTVRCHRKVIPLMRSAMRELRREGLGGLVHDYQGCFNARAVRDDPAGRLSHHSWGAAFDINASSNALGGTPHQDPRLVKIMRRHGFTWGGKWVRPDGMHFEWWRFPA